MCCHNNKNIKYTNIYPGPTRLYSLIRERDKDRNIETKKLQNEYAVIIYH